MKRIDQSSSFLATSTLSLLNLGVALDLPIILPKGNTLGRDTMSKKYIVRLAEEERKGLEDLVSKGKAAAYKIKHAHILLKADADGPNWKDKRIAEAFSVQVNTVGNVRQRLVEEGMEAALGRKKREHPPCERILDGKGEARLIALTRSQPPEGRCRWTLRLLADKMVELKNVDSISYETVRRTLKKTNSSPTCGSAG